MDNNYNYHGYRRINNNINNNYNYGYSYNNRGYYHYNGYNQPQQVYNGPRKRNTKWLMIGISFLCCFFVVIAGIIIYNAYKNGNLKSRTFMIYMVGSDLESKSKQGTYSISDIAGDRIDLENNNVVLIVGGSKKWHNFVSADEIGIYELTSRGFTKKESLAVKSMGTSDVLTNFLNYAYNNYPAKKFDIIFWNHGLGAAGVEQDEISNDYLSILDLKEAFDNSPFAKKKMELTIFYNCLEGNLHIANIMSNYSEYMVGSEEVLYLSKVLNRFNFLERVTPGDSAVDIAKYFIDQSDSVVNAYNSTHANPIDSTLSILDLNKIHKLNNYLNEFISRININNNYYKISNIRKNLYTYGRSRANDYDTIDLYDFVSALSPLVNDDRLANNVLNSLNEVIIYNSSFNTHSKGLSVYFPYYGNDLAIGIHLASFKKIWNDDYYSFISGFYLTRTGSNRASKDNSINLNILTNNIVKNGNAINLRLTDDERDNYQFANIYLFRKNGDKYELLLDSDDVILDGNNLVFKNNYLLSISGEIFSYIHSKDDYVYGKLRDDEDELNTIFNLGFDGNLGEIVGTILDSGIYPLSGLVEYDDYDVLSIGQLRYDLFENSNFNMNWKDTEQIVYFDIDKNNIDISLKSNKLPEYYALIEFHDIDNDIHYSKLGIIN